MGVMDTPWIPSGDVSEKEGSFLKKASALWGPLLGGAGYRGPVSDHFDGRHFHNLDHPEGNGFLSFLRWRLGRWLGQAGAWPSWTDAPPGEPPPPRVMGTALRVTFVNHATVLLQTEGKNILTDPIWSERASPVSWAGPRRRRPPGLRFEDLPAIDVVLISHNHYDHLDLPTLERLARVHQPTFLVGLGNGPLLTSLGIGPVTEMDWWEDSRPAGGPTVTCVPAKHFSSRGLRDRNRTLWCGYVIQGAAGPVYFAGDTGFGLHFEHIAERFGPPRLAVLPIGAYLPLWFMSPVHLSPEEAVRAHRVLGARTSLAIHFGTFPLANDSAEQAPAELRRVLAEPGADGREFWILQGGEGRWLEEESHAKPQRRQENQEEN